MSSLADSWDLSQIYQGYGDPAFQKDLAEGRLALQQAAEKVAGLTGAGLTEETVPPGPAAWEQSAALADALRAFDEAAIKLSLPEVYLQLAEAAGDLQGQEGAAAIRAEAGNLSYTLNQSTADVRLHAFIEVWQDQAAIDAHNRSEHFTRIVPQFAALTEERLPVEFFTEL